MSAARSIGLGALLLVTLPSWGCDPVMMARGTVTAADATCSASGSVYGAGTPIADATLAEHCPKGDDRVFAHSNANGNFEFSNVGLWRTDCSIVVQKPGFATQTFAIRDLCAYPNGDSSCHAVSVQAELVPVKAP